MAISDRILHKSNDQLKNTCFRASQEDVALYALRIVHLKDGLFDNQNSSLTKFKTRMEYYS